jgi:signal peptidase I
MNNILSITVQGHSMLPVFDTGDRVLVQKLNHTQPSLRWGDIIVFLYKGELLAHRIIYLSQRLIITKGDNYHGREVLRSTKNIIGKVVGIKKRNKTLYFNTYRYKMLNTYRTIGSIGGYGINALIQITQRFFEKQK